MLGFTSGVLLLSMTSSAFACTFFYGKLTVTATASGKTISAFADGNGDNAFHSYCPTPAPVDNVSGGVSELVYPAQGMYRASTVTVNVGPTTTCLPDQNSLVNGNKNGINTDGPYDVRWLNLTANDRTIADLPPADAPLNNVAPNCNFGEVVPGGPVKTVGTISIAGGVGAGSFSQPPSSAGDEVNICVKKPNTDANSPAPPQVKLRMI